MPSRKRNTVNIAQDNKNPYVQIGASIAGIFMLTALFVLLFAESQAGLLVPIAWAFAFLGAALAFFQSKSRK